MRRAPQAGGCSIACARDGNGAAGHAALAPSPQRPQIGQTTIRVTAVLSDVVEAHAFSTPPQQSYPQRLYHATGCLPVILLVDLFTFVVERMNANAALRQGQKGESSTCRATRVRTEPMATWTDTSAREVLAFVGCVLYMGFHNLGDIKDYWLADNNPQLTRWTFRRDRFLQLPLLYLSDTDDPDDPDGMDGVFSNVTVFNSLLDRGIYGGHHAQLIERLPIQRTAHQQHVREVHGLFVNKAI